MKLSEVERDSVALRIAGKSEMVGACILFRGTSNGRGYGRVWFRGKLQAAHRLAYAAQHGSLSENRIVRHKCDNPACVNPDHLESGTQLDNIRDACARNRHANSKLSPKDAQQIRIFRIAGHPVSRIADWYAVSAKTIHGIVTQKYWRAV